MDVVNLEDAQPFITADGSEIRELLAYRNSSIVHQSLAEARLAVTGSTTPHFHRRVEEIYYITHGSAEMIIDEERRPVSEGDAIAIPPGAVHQIINTGDSELRFLCMCAPAYEHSDTVLIDSTATDD